MQYLQRFNDKFGNFLTPGIIAFVVFMSTFGLKHFLSVISAFQNIEMLWIDKGLKALGTAVLTSVFIYELIKRKIDVKNIYFIGFIAYVFIFALKLATYYFSDGMVMGYLKQHINIFISTFSFFIVGFYFPKEIKKTYLYILVSVIFFLILYDLQFVELKFKGLNLYLVKEKIKRSNYLFWGDSFSLLSLLAIFSIKDWKRYLLIIFSTIGITLLLSRSSLLSYLFALFIGLIVTRDFKALIGLAVTGILGVTILFMTSLKLRALDITNISDDSLNSRIEIMRLGVESIKNNPIRGEFLGQLNNNSKVFNQIGFYIHNHLSIWRQFGILSFFIFLLYYYGAAKDLILKKNRPELVGLVTYILISIVFFRSYVFPFFWLIAGIVFSNLNFAKQQEQES